MLKLKVKTEIEQILVTTEERSLVKDVNNKIKTQAGYNGYLCLENFKLAEEDSISDLFEADKVYNYVKKELISLNLIPNGHWLNVRKTKRIEVSVTDTLDKLEKRVREEYTIKDSDYWLQMFNDRLPLFITNTSKTYTLKQLNFKSDDNLYVDSLPYSMNFEKRYDFVSEDERFKENEFWKFPKDQSKFSSSTFFSTLNVLKGFFKDYHNYGCDSLFFHLLYKFFPFPPAVASFYRLFRSQAMKLDLAIIGRAFYFWMAESVGSTPYYETKDAFNNFPMFIFSVLKDINFTSGIEQVNVFIDYSLENNSNKKFTDPVYYDNSVGERENFQNRNVTASQLIDAYDLRALQDTYIDESQIKNYLFCLRKPSDCEDFKKYREFMKLKNELSKHPWCRFLAYTPREIMESKKCHNCLSAIYDENSKQHETVVIVERLKNVKKYKVDVNHTTIIYDKFDLIMDKAKMNEFGLVVIEEAIDTRPLEQIDVVLLDISGSMADTIAIKRDGQSSIQKCNASVACTTNIIDKINQYDLSHALGLIIFNEKTDKRDITRDFEYICTGLDLNKTNGGTNLWQAVKEAAEVIKSYKNNAKHKFSCDLKSRILCITDGEDTSGVDYKNIVKILEKEEIYFDSVFINKDKKGNACKSINVASKKTGGTCIDTVQDLKKLIDTITSEAFLSINQRKEKKRADKSIEEIEGDATRGNLEPNKLELNQIPMNTIAVKSPNINQIEIRKKEMTRHKRILLEFKDAQNIIDNFEIFIDEQHFDYWRVIFTPSVGSLYYSYNPKRFWFLTIRFPETYPQTAPEVRFITKLYHPNVNADGRICHEIFASKHHVLVSVANIFAQILDMINDPNESDALDAEAAELYRDYKEKKRTRSDIRSHQYLEKICECKSNAFSDKARLKLLYNLSD